MPPVSGHIVSFDSHSFVEWLAGCDSRDEMHAAIRAWLRANPRAPTIEHHLARVDDALAGWYRAEYDPRLVSPAIAELIATAEQLSSGREEVRAWVEDWAHEPHKGLGGLAPVKVLHTSEGLNLARHLLIGALDKEQLEK